MPKNLTQKQIIIIGGAVLAVIVVGVVFMLSIRSGGGGAASASTPKSASDFVTLGAFFVATMARSRYHRLPCVPRAASAEGISCGNI